MKAVINDIELDVDFAVKSYPITLGKRLMMIDADTGRDILEIGSNIAGDHKLEDAFFVNNSDPEASNIAVQMIKHGFATFVCHTQAMPRNNCKTYFVIKIKTQ